MLDELPGDAGTQRAHVLTLVWRKDRGWTLFGVGPYLPWNIPFATGELEVDPLEGREKL